MKFRLFLALLAIVALATTAQATDITSLFTNADFDSGSVTSGSFVGFDAPAATEIEGWTNYGTVNDAGVQAAGAWWLSGYTNVNCAFVNAGGGASNISSYVIEDGNQFTVSLFSDAWWTTDPTVTVMLWYDDPANVIGTYDLTTIAWNFTTLTTTAIDATSASVGGTLGVTVYNASTSGIITFDEVTVNIVPEPATLTMLVLAGVLGFWYKKRK